MTDFRADYMITEKVYNMLKKYKGRNPYQSTEPLIGEQEYIMSFDYPDDYRWLFIGRRNKGEVFCNETFTILGI